MKKTKRKYSVTQLSSSIFMMLTLLWLTVSAPFTYSVQQKIVGLDKSVNINSAKADSNDEETANSFGNNTEENTSKNTGSTSFSEEYLHDHHITDRFFSIALQYHKRENTNTYIAFHGELLVPPPNVA